MGCNLFCHLSSALPVYVSVLLAGATRTIFRYKLPFKFFAFEERPQGRSLIFLKPMLRGPTLVEIGRFPLQNLHRDFFSIESRSP